MPDPNDNTSNTPTSDGQPSPLNFTFTSPEGRNYTVTGPSGATSSQAYQILQQHLSANPSPRSDTDIGNAMLHGAADTLRGTGTTMARYFGWDGADAVFKRAANAIDDPNYKASPVVQNGTIDASAIPGAVAESVPSAGPAIAAGYLTSRALSKLPGAWPKLAGAGVGGLTYWLQNAGNNADATAVARTGDTNATPTTADLVRGGVTTAAQAGANEALAGVPFLPGVMKTSTSGVSGVRAALNKLATRTAGGGAAAAATDTIGQLGTAGTVDPDQVESSAVTGAATSGTLGAHGAYRDAANAVKYRAVTPALEPAATRFANLMVANSQGRNINSPAVGYDAFTRAQGQSTAALGTAVKNAGQLTPDAETVIRAVKQGRTISPQDYQTVQTAAGNGAAGQELINRLQDVHVSNLVGNTGLLTGDKFVGGTLPAFTKLIGLTGHGAVRSLVAAKLAEDFGSEIFHQSPEALATMAGVAALAGARDWSTGNLSPAARFIDRYGANPSGPVSATLVSPSPAPAPMAPIGAPPSPWGPRPPAPSVPQVPLSGAIQRPPTALRGTAVQTGTPASTSVPPELQTFLHALAARSKLQQDAATTTDPSQRSVSVRAPRSIGKYGRSSGRYRPR